MDDKRAHNIVEISGNQYSVTGIKYLTQNT